MFSCLEWKAHLFIGNVKSGFLRFTLILSWGFCQQAKGEQEEGRRSLISDGNTISCGRFHPLLSQMGVFNNTVRGAVFISCCRLAQPSAIKVDTVREGIQPVVFQVGRGKTVTASHTDPCPHTPHPPTTHAYTKFWLVSLNQRTFRGLICGSYLILL